MFPEDLRYTDKHEWVRVGNGATARVGITSYAADALGDVVYVSLPQVGEEVALDDACAEVESTKSVSDVAAHSGVLRSIAITAWILAIGWAIVRHLRERREAAARSEDSVRLGDLPDVRSAAELDDARA